MKVKSLDWPSTLEWLVTQLDRPLNVTVSGPSGVLIDGPMWLTRGVDCMPGEYPTVLWLALDAGFGADPLRLWINVYHVQSVSMDETSGTLTINFTGNEEYRLHPIDSLHG